MFPLSNAWKPRITVAHALGCYKYFDAEIEGDDAFCDTLEYGFVRPIRDNPIDGTRRLVLIGRRSRMRESTRTIWKVVLSIFLGLFSLPMLLFGGFFIVSFVRINISGVYYGEYPYGTAALIWIGLGSLSLWAALHGVWRRSYYGAIFAVPVFLGLAAMVMIPDLQPIYSSKIADSNFLQHVNANVEVWYRSHHRFPNSATEFRDAIGSVALEQSAYRQRGKSLRYEIVAMADATGPLMDGVSTRPGEVYYCVSSNAQEFWVTMTALPTTVASSAVLARFLGLPYERVLVVHAKGGDYAEKKPL